MLREGVRGDSGFTLAELLVAMAILTLIIGVLTTGLIVGLRTTRDTTTRLDQSNTRQILNTFLTKDLEAACTPGIGDSATTVPLAATCPATNPTINPGTVCGVPAQLAFDVFATATATTTGGGLRADTTVAYSRVGSVLSRVTCGAISSTTTIGDDLQNFQAQDATAGTSNCPALAGTPYQLQVTVTAQGAIPFGTATTIPPSAFFLCLHRRTG